MFDIGFWELALIFVITLIVVGPDRLPGVVRTAGNWIGRGRMMMSKLRDDLEREIQADELRRQVDDLRQQADDLHDSVQTGIKDDPPRD